MFANTLVATIDTAIIRSSHLVLFCKKVFLQISQHKKMPKKRFRHRCFLMNSAKFLIHNIFFKELFGRLLQHKHSFCLLSHHDLSHFQKRCHTYFLAEYFFGLIFTLGARVSSIFHAHSQKPIFNPVEHLRGSLFFAKIVSSLKPLIFYKKSSIAMFARF